MCSTFCNENFLWNERSGFAARCRECSNGRQNDDCDTLENESQLNLFEFVPIQNQVIDDNIVFSG